MAVAAAADEVLVDVTGFVITTALLLTVEITGEEEVTGAVIANGVEEDTGVVRAAALELELELAELTTTELAVDAAELETTAAELDTTTAELDTTAAELEITTAADELVLAVVGAAEELLALLDGECLWGGLHLDGREVCLLPPLQTLYLLCW